MVDRVDLTTTGHNQRDEVIEVMQWDIDQKMEK